ncbi:TetR/AcrR family transcriptional regulator [Secundilactobacillus folii]|uniref:TetR/AcrR family transcriptional regulator n=1 Tax=Secundilactobacillus folii TaxID=2678357 RepID=A0A7X3C2E2_9LACO|nr:TetR/AcrR family transcriptional regulator [Secundilactobacillus folii]MTV82755.1 TetR/AcrR family transcriptional regulator [Secundilactobacillus folii]
MSNSKDLRVIKTKTTIERAFISLLKNKSFERITVQNILDEALINHKTFYAHYADKYQLADIISENLINKFQLALTKRFKKPVLPTDSSASMRTFYLTIFKDREAMLAMFKVKTNNHYLWDDLMDILKSTYHDHLTFITKSEPSHLEADYLCLSYAVLALNSIQWALTIGTSEAIDTVIRAYSNSLPAPLWPPSNF